MIFNLQHKNVTTVWTEKDSFDIHIQDIYIFFNHYKAFVKIQVELFQEQEKTEKGGPTVNHHDRTHLQSQLLLVPSASMRKLSTFYTRVQRSFIKGFNLLFTLVKEDKTLRKKRRDTLAQSRLN